MDNSTPFKKKKVRYISGNLCKHPSCPHGPTLLFSRWENDKQRKFFACAACRDRKDCEFFVWQDELEKFSNKKKDVWSTKIRKYKANTDHISLYKLLNEVKCFDESQRMYCSTCDSFQLPKYQEKHKGHSTTSISDLQLSNPSQFLSAKVDSKKEAQHFFTNKCVDNIVKILTNLNFEYILCIGCPTIHEKIRNKKPEMTSLLLDFDKRFLNFLGPLEFCWYNLFNHHFFTNEAKQIFEDFLTNGAKVALVTDPPFGGRIEPITESINKINRLYQKCNNFAEDLAVFWTFPYFMETQIKNSLPNYEMMDFCINYSNPVLECNRRNTSLVKIFTNVKLSSINLSGISGYKFCKPCDKYVAHSNKHCDKCDSCTSKDGGEYRHCDSCQRCVKITWQHCDGCKKCAFTTHNCKEIEFEEECFHCEEPGHKKANCPMLQPEKEKKSGTKRKFVVKDSKKKRKKSK